MDEEQKLSCPICDLHVVKLYDMGKSKVCRYCKKDKLLNRKYTRKKVKHNFESATKLIKELHHKAKERK